MYFVIVCLVGFVTWKEFHIHFLLAKGYKQNETLQHVEDYESLSIDSEGPLSIYVLQDASDYKLHWLISCVQDDTEKWNMYTLRKYLLSCRFICVAARGLF